MTIVSSRICIYVKTSIHILVNMNTCLESWLFNVYFPFVIGAYKQAGGQAIDHEEQIFNNALTSPCVSSDHTIVMWKGRFPWLHSIHMKITSSKMSV